MRLEEETVWLTQAQMGQLFGKDKRTISEHIGNIFKEGELIERVVVRKFRTTTQHGAMAGKTQDVDSILKFGNSEFQQKSSFLRGIGRKSSCSEIPNNYSTPC